MKKLRNLPIVRGAIVPKAIGTALLLLFAVQAEADSLEVSAQVHTPQLEHIAQQTLNRLVLADPLEAFEQAFEKGDALFGTAGNELDGIGANVGNGSRFAKHPRIDLTGPRQWANHSPPRVTGPNSQACNECHFRPAEDGSGPVSANNVRDPYRSGDIGLFITRQPPHIFGIGAKQRLAEEMTQQLHQIRDSALEQASASTHKVKADLIAKGINFGRIAAYPDGSIDFSKVEGVDDDLIIKPLQWKGTNFTIRDFVRGAENNELGLQAVELVGMEVDGDFDQIVNELTVGDITALTIYQAAQPRPVTKIELARLGLMTLSREELNQIAAGEQVFITIKCSDCHITELLLDSPIFSEPSRSAAYRDQSFPSGADPRDLGLTPRAAVSFDLTQDIPDNIIELENGSEVHLGNFKKIGNQTVVNIFSDLKRHDLGKKIAEPIDEVGTGSSVFITQPLWGAGSTAPYMHDGRSPTITDAILQHGGEAAASSREFVHLDENDKKALVAYIENQVLFKQAEDDE